MVLLLGLAVVRPCSFSLIHLTLTTVPLFGQLIYHEIFNVGGYKIPSNESRQNLYFNSIYKVYLCSGRREFGNCQ